MSTPSRSTKNQDRLDIRAAKGARSNAEEPSALERAAVRHLLAFSARPLARLIQYPDAVGGRFRRLMSRFFTTRVLMEFIFGLDKHSVIIGA